MSSYINQDRIALGLTKNIFQNLRHLSSMELWKYEKIIRRYEYHLNKHHKFRTLFWHVRWFFYGRKFDMTVPPNVFGPGLALIHHGIVVNENARVGKNCRILTGTVIGSNGWEKKAAIIGDDVFIGAGVKIIGEVHIASGVAIGAGAVVVKDINEANTSWAGVPAHKISNHGSADYLDPSLKR